MSTLVPREVELADAASMEQLLTWLGQEDRFIDAVTGDGYRDIIAAFRADTGTPAGDDDDELIAFLEWMDYGDRIRVEHETPYGLILSFYYADYRDYAAGVGMLEAPAVAARAMVECYQQGE